MNFVIPMGGRGQRFVDAGYDVPKMLIKAKGKTLLEWSIDSLPLDLCTRLICIILTEHETQYHVSKIISELYKKYNFDIRFLFLESVTSGQAETVWLARHHFLPGAPLLIFNIDTRFRSQTLEKALKNPNSDGVLGAFHNTESRFSYAKVNTNGFVTETAEKVVISQNALTGLYHFTNAEYFIDTAEYHFAKDIRVNNEFYIAPMYNYLIKKGKNFTIDLCEEHDILGTPNELNVFISK